MDYTMVQSISIKNKLCSSNTICLALISDFSNERSLNKQYTISRKISCRKYDSYVRSWYKNDHEIFHFAT